MKIVVAADGSPFTKKALAYLVTNPHVLGDGELLVLNVQPPLPPHVESYISSQTVAAYHRDEATRVLAPVEEFLKRHPVKYQARWVVGIAADEILQASRDPEVRMIVMGTHGYGALGRLVMGSVAQKVVAAAEVPVLLVK